MYHSSKLPETASSWIIPYSVETHHHISFAVTEHYLSWAYWYWYSPPPSPHFSDSFCIKFTIKLLFFQTPLTIHFLLNPHNILQLHWNCFWRSPMMNSVASNNLRDGSTFMTEESSWNRFFTWFSKPIPWLPSPLISLTLLFSLPMSLNVVVS